MKAWRVHVKDEPYATVVFAETRGKARSLALHTDACEYVNFTDIEVHRFKQADSQYNGRKEMEWDNPQDRLFLVKQGWSCAEDFIAETDCENCCAKEYCEVYLDRSDAEWYNTN